MKSFLNHISAPSFPIAGLDKMVLRVPPVVAKPTPEAGGLHLQLAVGDRHGDSDRGDRRPALCSVLGRASSFEAI